MESAEMPKNLFIKNRSKLKDLLLPGSCALLFSSGQMPRNGDQFFPYRQNSDFFYLTGIDEDDSALIISPSHPEEKYREILLIRRTTPEFERWNGKRLSKSEASDRSGIKTILFSDELEEILYAVIPRAEHIYLYQPENIRLSYPVETREMKMPKKIRERFPVKSFHSLAPFLLRLRMIKEEEELAQIRHACSITRSALLKIMHRLTPGMTEKEVEAEMIAEFTRRGSKGHAFSPIVASGKNACYLHYTTNHDVCREGELILLDFGAEWNNYASDCSRTLPVNGRFSPRQAELYDGLLEVFYRAREWMKPGILMQDFHNEVCTLMEEFHIKLGLYSRKEAEESKGEVKPWFRYYMHGTSHSMGLDVHDVFDKSVHFAEGMVFTCEPGIYIESENTGIRIENDILITREGNVDLMEDFPITRQEIEDIMNS
jgi:Xaa-Pro aminopeptidase